MREIIIGEGELPGEQRVLEKPGAELGCELDVVGEEMSEDVVELLEELW